MNTYVLKNMEILERMPFTARKAVFDRLEQMASKANMSAEERLQYETEWKICNDYYNTLDSARREERISMARNLKDLGVPFQTIAQASGLSLEEIAKL